MTQLKSLKMVNQIFHLGPIFENICFWKTSIKLIKFWTKKTRCFYLIIFIYKFERKLTIILAGNFREQMKSVEKERDNCRTHNCLSVVAEIKRVIVFDSLKQVFSLNFLLLNKFIR
jgi:hypothetical protein